MNCTQRNHSNFTTSALKSRDPRDINDLCHIKLSAERVSLTARRALRSSCCARPVQSRNPYIFPQLADSIDRRDLLPTDGEEYVCDLPLQTLWLAEMCNQLVLAREEFALELHRLSYYSISNRFKFTVVSLHCVSKRLAASSPSSLTFSQGPIPCYSIAVRQTYPFLLPNCCSLVGSPRCRLRTGVRGGNETRTRNY